MIRMTSFSDSYLIALETIGLSGVGAKGSALPREGQVEAFTVLTDPPSLAGGDAGHEGVRFDVAGDDGAGGNEGVFTKGDATDDGRVGANRSATFDQGATVFVLADDSGTRVINISEDHAGAAEDVVLQGDSIVDADVVLDLTVVTDDHVIADKNVLTEGTVGAYACASTDMGPMPDAGTLP